MQAPGPTDEHTNSGGDDLVGRVLEDRYRLVGELGSGGIGVVYRAEHIKLGRPVALKVLHKDYGDSPQLRQRFEREARALAALSQHPNIVPITDYGIADDMPYLVMDLLQGRSLQELLDDEAPLAPERAFEIGLQTLRGLAFAHGEGLIHRDLKPANVFVQALPDSADHVRILDFGLAKFVASEQQAPDGAPLTRTGQVFGTPAYMGPEQATGSQTDTRTDVYAMGVMLFELLAGRRPFIGDRAELLRQHLLTPAPSIADVAPERVPRGELDALLQRAMAKNQADRFADATELLHAFEALPRPSLEVSGHAPSPEVAASAPTMAGGTPNADAPPHAASTAGAPGTTAGGAAVATGGPGSVTGVGGASGVRRKTSLLVGAGLGLGLLAFIGLGGAIALFVVFGGEQNNSQPAGSDPSSAKPPPPPPPSDDDEEEGDEPQGVAAPDPWGRGVPEQLQAPHASAERGRDPGRQWDGRLRIYARRNDDARGLLLLARIFKIRGWRPAAIDMYERAWEMDAAARGDPQMLSDLLDLVGRSDKHARKAIPLIEKAYGDEAVPRIERALAAGGTDADSEERLRHLKRRLDDG